MQKGLGSIPYSVKIIIPGIIHYYWIHYETAHESTEVVTYNLSGATLSIFAFDDNVSASTSPSPHSPGILKYHVHVERKMKIENEKSL